MSVILTEELLKKYATNGVGYSYAQLHALGVSLPPKAGWLQAIIGKEITQDKFELFTISGRSNGTKNDRRKRKELMQLNTIERQKFRLLSAAKDVESAMVRMAKSAEELMGATGNDTFSWLKHKAEDVDYLGLAVEALSNAKILKFNYEDEAYRGLRHLVFIRHGEVCGKCGFKPFSGSDNWLEIDHVKPVSLFPWLSLDVENMQVLCKECNREKSNKNCKDYRGGK